MTWKTSRRAAVGALLMLATAAPAFARPDPQDEAALREIQARLKALSERTAFGRTARPAAEPDIFGPGAVLNVGNVVMKVTNYGVIGNPFPNISSDPSAQWPGSSGVEYLFFLAPAVGAVNPTATDPKKVRRVSTNPDWWPPTPDPEDRMYRAYDGIINGARLTNDDSDVNLFTGAPNVDEDFLDGRDNDGDGRIDEDYAALGQLMFSCVMRDDTEAAITFVSNEQHVPLVLEMRQLAWAYSVPGFTDFNVIQWDVYNRSGHTLDSMYVGVRMDVDAGPLELSTYFSEDFDLPSYPAGDFALQLDESDNRFLQTTGDPPVSLCPEMNVRVQGFSVVDNDGDEGRTRGVASFLLFGHTVDPLGLRAPRRTGLRAYRSYVQGTPFASGGAPSTDQQRFEFLSSRQNIDLETGFVNQERGDQPGDYQGWCSTGPYLNIPNGGMVTITIGFAVQIGDLDDIQQYPADYTQYRNGNLRLEDIFEKYPAVENAFTAQVAYEGVYELPRPGFEELVPTTCHGCETGIKLPSPSSPTLIAEVCPDREAVQKLVTDNAYTWFDFDCNACTGVCLGNCTPQSPGTGYYLRHWNAESPPPNPNLNVNALHNYSDNPNRVVASGDNVITLAWDNISETTPDPKAGTFDFRTYRIWKVAGWRRPVGAAGPNDEDWALLGEYRLFDHASANFTDPNNCPQVLVPNYHYPEGHPHCSDPFSNATPLTGGGCRDSATIGICLTFGDFWDRQSGDVIRPANVDCVRDAETDSCVQDSGKSIRTGLLEKRTRYPVGRYVITDPEVKNGFIYFYSVTAGDSTVGGELHGRRSAVEADHVTPQVSPRTGQNVWVVPNPYRGFRNILERPSSWDLTPNATDPTGTHIDFMGMPPGKWKIRIYTVSGDLVAELHDDDPVNESLRNEATDEQGNTHPGYNRQQDHPGDGQARWNLISRNGQDVVSGIYLFVVESDQGQQRGKFVIVR